MKPELQKQLFDRYPKIFRQKDLSMKETCMVWGIDCESGWYQILDNLCACIQGRVDSKLAYLVARKKYLTLRMCIKDLVSSIAKLQWLRNPHIIKWDLRQLKEWLDLRGKIDPLTYQVEATQVKEKYGTLRFYVDHADEEVNGMISMAEAMSAVTCETCGTTKGAKVGGSGWLSCRCDKCRKKMK
jgi:hypothetical protein